MGQRQICSGGSTGQGVIRLMNSARARAQGTEAGQPPDRHKVSVRCRRGLRRFWPASSKA